jgi:hypothetical protein
MEKHGDVLETKLSITKPQINMSANIYLSTHLSMCYIYIANIKGDFDIIIHRNTVKYSRF